MRLEQKPDQPSALSVRQLMRELREGLKIACMHRQRFEAHSIAAISSINDSESNSDNLFHYDIKEFDKSLKGVFELYLSYLEQWVEMSQHDSYQKNLIDDEWTFVTSIAGNIPDGHALASVKFWWVYRIVVFQEA